MVIFQPDCSLSFSLFLAQYRHIKHLTKLLFTFFGKWKNWYSFTYNWDLYGNHKIFHFLLRKRKSIFKLHYLTRLYDLLLPLFTYCFTLFAIIFLELFPLLFPRAGSLCLLSTSGINFYSDLICCCSLWLECCSHICPH